jgi:hypothetical protein
MARSLAADQPVRVVRLHDELGKNCMPKVPPRLAPDAGEEPCDEA